MRVVDTSAWIEWLIGSRTGDAVRSELPERDRWVVPTIVQLELSKWLTREVGEDRADPVIAFSLKCHVVSLDTGIALRAAELGRQFGLATADAIVYASAQARGADLLTCDAHFERLPDVRFIAKTA